MALSPLIANCHVSALKVVLPRLCHPSRGRGHLQPHSGFSRALQITYRPFVLSTSARSSATRTEDAPIFEQYMARKLSLINEALELAVPLRHPPRIHESMRYTLLAPGKRVAAMLCLASCELVGGDESRAMPAACAMEMVHSMSLIHDDLPCLDDDDLRRGKVANHRAFDEGTALLAGDALLGLAFEHMAKTENVPASRVVRAVLELSRAVGSEGIQGGQIMDKLYQGRKDLDLSELEYIHTHKAFIGMAATVCGAIMGGGNEDEIERLRAFGTKAGLLYQVIDDVLDVTRPSEELGKNVGSDLVMDKATFPKLMGIEGAKKYAFELLDDVIGELSYFDDERAFPLRQLASFFINRQK